MGPLMDELVKRWDAMFQALAAGADVAPSARMRAEGVMEAVVLVGEADEAAVHAAMQACYLRAFNRGLAEDFGDGWQTFFPFPQIPAVAQRAPVYPSTAD